MNTGRILISTTPRSWFLRGFAGGLLVSAGLNALSYFFRSDHWGNLVGTQRQNREALGFPREMWEQGNSYGGFFVDYPAFLQNVLFGALLGGLLGLVALWQQARLNQLVADWELSERPTRRNFQVSLRGMILAMTVIAAVLAIGTRVRVAQPAVLGSIYLLGPWLLIAIAFVPRNIPWQQRAALLIPCMVLLMSWAIYVGSAMRRSLEFDRVLLGIFICWTPQTVFVALAVTILVICFHRTTHSV